MKVTDTKYTVLTMNVGSYEIIHPVLEKSPRARYVLVTDDPDLKDESNTWEVIYDPELSGSPIDRTYQIRYNPFKYTDDKYVIKIDGSVGVMKNIDKLIDKFIENGDDISLMLHPGRNTLYDEYVAWVSSRGYSADNANMILNFLQNMEGYNVRNYKGLCQLCYAIQKNDRVNNDLNRMVYAWIKYLGDKSGIERVDQCIFSFIAQKYFNTMKIMWVDQRMYCGEYFEWYQHNSNEPFKHIEDPKDMIEPYWNNKRVHKAIRPQDL